MRDGQAALALHYNLTKWREDARSSHSLQPLAVQYLPRTQLLANKQLSKFSPIISNRAQRTSMTALVKHKRSWTADSLCSNVTAMSDSSSTASDSDVELRYEERVTSEWTASGDSSAAASSCGDAITAAVIHVQRTSHWAKTEDGWNLHLLHVSDPAQRSDAQRSRRRPVLLVPGLASSGVQTYDLDPSVSLAQHLAQLGWDVWVADLRGNGFSDKPSWFSGGAQWSVDTHLQSDAPAVLDYVLEATGHSQVHWIGHSMGGMIACGLISSRSPHAAALASITTLASGCFGAGSWHAWARGLINAITSGWGFPAGGACKLMSMLTGTPLSLACLETLFFWRSNMPVALQRKLLASCFSYIPTGVIQQFMGSLNTPQGITATDGKFRYADPEALSQCTTPIMGLTGDWDLFCPAAGGYKTINAFGSAAKKFVFLGPGYGTTQEHYGHFDVVAGSRVMEEVYPHITQWLQQVEGL